MKKISTWFVVALILVSQIYSQELPALKLKDSHGTKGNFFNKSSSNLRTTQKSKSSLEGEIQVKKRSVVSSYYGAGYTFVIFTAAEMNEAYPVFDTRNGDFLSEINLYFGFAIARAVTLEIETAILFTHNDRTFTFGQHPPYTFGGQSNQYITAYQLGMLTLSPAVNVRFFPFFMKTTSFARLFFIGGGAGVAWIKEDYDYYLGQVSIAYNPIFFNNSTSQWQPVLRVMAGFTGSGGQFGFGGEVRYNMIPLKETAAPFITRLAKNYNSVDLTARFYFSL
jgi:hypothetical protein